jgi:hypothetical protein
MNNAMSLNVYKFTFTKERSIPMNYRKPQVVALGPACNRIQGFADKNPYCAPDADHTSSYLSTGGSYDLDE